MDTDKNRQIMNQCREKVEGVECPEKPNRFIRLIKAIGAGLMATFSRDSEEFMEKK